IARAAGAEATVDYRTQDLAEAVRHFAGGAGIDRVIEVNLSANAGRYVEYLRHEGLAVVYGSDSWVTELPLGAWLVHGIELAIFIVYELPPFIREAAIAATQKLLADPSF